MPSKIIPYTTGGIAVFVGLKASPTATTHTPHVLGHGIQSPQIRTLVRYSPLFLDVGGDQIPTDDIYAGREKISMIDLGSWSEDVLKRLERVIDRGSADDKDIEHEHDRGTIMNLEGASFPVWFLNLRRDVPAMKQHNMPDGHHLFFTRTVEVMREGGVKQNHVAITFHHRGFWNPADGKFRLGDRNMSAVAGLSLT